LSAAQQASQLAAAHLQQALQSAQGPLHLLELLDSAHAAKTRLGNAQEQLARLKLAQPGVQVRYNYAGTTIQLHEELTV
jgi:hypothetical protein